MDTSLVEESPVWSTHLILRLGTGSDPQVRFLPAFLVILMQTVCKPHFEKRCLKEPVLPPGEKKNSV